ncbi:unnamed protein product [Caenorhabditis auriculariae]|uniref:Uncharacterized protein n=1 Tax=Caenorhabditis auriculariae TaxID=2777116 RepID=A0A8S1HU91_9PELO|nr:unnamed protein product [Caenorhabditis auriculariae]
MLFIAIGFFAIFVHLGRSQDDFTSKCIDSRYHEIADQCKNVSNSRPRCDLTAEEDVQLLKELQECCRNIKNCVPRSFEKYCCEKEPCALECKDPMPANGKSVVVPAIRKLVLGTYESTGKRVFRAELMRKVQKRLIYKLDRAINSKRIDEVLEIMAPSVLIVYNGQVVDKPEKMSEFMDARLLEERTIHFLVDAVYKPGYGSAVFFFKGFMCSQLDYCSEFSLTYKWNPKKKNFFIIEFKNNETTVQPDIHDYPYTNKLIRFLPKAMQPARFRQSVSIEQVICGMVREATDSPGGKLSRSLN